MSRIGTRIATIAAAAGGLATAFLALSPTAAADSVPVIPSLPGINVVQQLANAPALASQLLQNAATMLQPAPAAAPAPTASASLNLPSAIVVAQSPAVAVVGADEQRRRDGADGAAEPAHAVHSAAQPAWPAEQPKLTAAGESGRRSGRSGGARDAGPARGPAVSQPVLSAALRPRTAAACQ